MVVDPAIAAVVGGVLTAAIGTPMWNRAATKRQLASQASKSDAESHVLVADAAIRIMREAVERSERAERRADEAHEIATRAVHARDLHVDALKRQIINREPPPPCEPPMPY